MLEWDSNQCRPEPNADWGEFVLQKTALRVCEMNSYCPKLWCKFFSNQQHVRLNLVMILNLCCSDPELIKEEQRNCTAGFYDDLAIPFTWEQGCEVCTCFLGETFCIPPHCEDLVCEMVRELSVFYS